MERPIPQPAPLARPRAEELGAWMAQYGPGLRRFFRRRVGPAEAEDMVQDVFLAMSGRQGDPVDNVAGYLFRIATNLIARRQGREAGRPAIEAMLESPEDFSPERILMSKQDAARVLAAIRNLPPRTREAFIFHRFEEMTYPAIGRRMGISPRTVEKLISLALKRLIVSVEARS